MFKKIIAVLTVLLAFGTLSYADGKDNNVIYPAENTKCVIQKIEKTGSKPNNLYSSGGVTLDDAYDDIKDAMLKHKDSVDVSMYGFKYNEEMEDIDSSLWQIYQRAAFKNPSSFAIYNAMSNIKITSDNKIVEIGIPYLFSSGDMAECDRIYNENIQKFVDYGSNFKTDFDKVLAIHDKIIDDYDYWQLYDEEGNEIFDSFDFPQITSSPMAFFLYGKATCVGYSQLFGAVMEKFGIDVEYCTNENHIWNLVSVDGKWYHIDNTFDDPIYTDSDENGVKRVYRKGAHHGYFLVTEETMMSDSGHFINDPWEYTKYYKTEDKTYENNTVFSVFGNIHTMFYKNTFGNYDFSLTAADKVAYTFTSVINLPDVLHTNIYKTASGSYAVQFYSPDKDLSEYSVFVGYYDKNGVFLDKENADMTNLYTGNSKVNYYTTDSKISADAKKIKFDKNYEKSGNKAVLYVWNMNDLSPCSVISGYEF